MYNLKRHRWVILSCVAGALAAGCHGLTFQGARPMPGNGPNGTVLRSSSQIAVGMNPSPETPPIYPITARVNVTDKYNGVAVEDPYRWLEDLDSDATRRWVEAQNKISKPWLEGIPHRVDRRRADHLVRSAESAGSRRKGPGRRTCVRY